MLGWGFNYDVVVYPSVCSGTEDRDQRSGCPLECQAVMWSKLKRGYWSQIFNKIPKQATLYRTVCRLPGPDLSTRVVVLNWRQFCSP